MLTLRSACRAAAACVVCCAVCASPALAGTSIALKRTAILHYISGLPAEQKTLVATQVNEYEVYIDCTSADRLRQMTGKRVALLGLELMNAIAYPPYESYLVDRAVTQTEAGGLVTMSWHERNPVEVCQRGEYYECAKKAMTAQTLQAVLTPGTREHQLWLSDVDAIAKVLRRLQSRGVVVLFRPYHEMNGNWFWWGQKDAYPRLWDALYDELVVRQKLENLIWVWSIDRDAPDAAPYFPARHRPDVVGTDVYEADPATPKYAAARAGLAALSGGAPFAITETGLAPASKVLDETNPAWVLLWGDNINVNWTWNGQCPSCNTPQQIAGFFALARIVTLDKLPPALRATISSGVANPHPLHQPEPYCPSQLH
ncbi:MAG: hypothetical protein KGJ78_14830 [Alphaproteobacteria bacterium]|nr:hypothetical protein [Alphaproteobacteria bacterium]